MARKSATTEGGNGPLPADWSKDLDTQMDADLDAEARQVEEEFGPAPGGGSGEGRVESGEVAEPPWWSIPVEVREQVLEALRVYLGPDGESRGLDEIAPEIDWKVLVDADISGLCDWVEAHPETPAVDAGVDVATLDAEGEARAAERDREVQPAELDRWVAEFKRGVEAASHAVEDVAWNTSGKVQAKLSMTCTLTMDDGKLALDCALSETVLTMKAGGKQSFCQTDMPVAAARRAAFYGHTAGQLRLMIGGVDEETAVEMAATAGDDVPAEGALGEALAGAFGEDGAAAEREPEPAEAVA